MPYGVRRIGTRGPKLGKWSVFNWRCQLTNYFSRVVFILEVSDYRLLQVEGNWTSDQHTVSSLNVRTFSQGICIVPDTYIYNSHNLNCIKSLQNYIYSSPGEWQGGFHPLPLLPLAALQRGHLPQVVEQELQGHQPPPVLHHVRGQDQHRPRLQFVFITVRWSRNWSGLR